MTDIAGRLRAGVLVCDGAMGTMLHAAGNSLDQALPALNLADPGLVRRVHDSYVEAGVDIIQTNTFGGSRLRLAEYALGDSVEEINRAAVRIAREAAAERPVLVAGSVSPAVSVHQRPGVPAAERGDALREQIAVLVDAGVDLVLLETFGYLDELVEAVQVALATATVPVVAQATFTADGRTLSGHTPRQVVEALAGAKLLALGTNCVLGPQRSLQIVRELREHSALPLTAQPNAGLPRRVTPARFEYDIDAEYFARYLGQLVEAGARIVGGCCGTTPTMVAAVVEVVRAHQASRPAVTAVDRVPAVPATEARPPGRSLAVQLVTPPRGAAEESVEVATGLAKLGVDLLTVVPARTPRAHISPVDLGLLLHQRLGVDPMPTATTWDRTSVVLQAELLGAHALGVRRIVCETGNPPLRGDYPHVDALWDLDSIGLIEMLARLNEGIDHYGVAVPARTRFEIGARVNPGSHEPARERARTLDKLAAGAQFLVTRPVYEPDGLAKLLEVVDGRVPVLASLAPLTGFAQADFLGHEVPDVTIPAATLRALHRAGDAAEQAGLELTAQLAAEVAPLVDGLVLAPRQNVVAAVRTLLSALPR